MIDAAALQTPARRSGRSLASLLLLWGMAPLTALAAAPLHEVRTAKSAVQGRVIAQDPQNCWLLAQDGRIHQFQLDKRTTLRKLGSFFASWPATVVRDRVRKELGPNWEAAVTRHYVVFARSRDKARLYADWFEDVYVSFRQHFTARGFSFPEPEFPLVAIVFPDQAAFTQYAAREKVQATQNLQGYYLAASNRVALFEQSTPQFTWQAPRRNTPGDLFTAQRIDPVAESPFDALPWGVVKSESPLHDTIVHEGTHQVAFNLGLHARCGQNPKWLVEGLATVFEAPGIRNSSANHGVKSRINRERYLWFGNYAKTRRVRNSLEDFLTGDADFSAQTLDAYSQAWAFTFFLVETRAQKYSQYLQKVAKRNPLREYLPAERLADFQSIFGKESRVLEAQFLRFMEQIKL